MSKETITRTLLQEVMFELYDVSKGETKMSKSLAKELAEKLEEVEGGLNVIEKVKLWLEEEVKHNELVLDEKELLSDGSYNIHYGRYECVKSLLRQIDKWQKVWCDD